MIGLLLLAQAATPPAPPLPPPGVAPSLIDFWAGPVRCAGQEVRTLAPIRPIPSLAQVDAAQPIGGYTLRFRIGADGRALSITPEPREIGGPYVPIEDLQPAVAAARFAPGIGHAACTIRFEGVASPVYRASIALVHRYIALPHTRGYGEEAVEKRLREASPGCFMVRPPAVLLQGFPDFDRIPQPGGALSMTMVAFDIDHRGRSRAVRTLTSDGNAALDAAGRDAIAKSRYVSGSPRTGCTYPYHRRQAQPLVAPMLPDSASFRPANANCGALSGSWTLPPRLTFPEPFRRRAIEGVAIVRYDVAPWGQTGNVTVIASEPAASFGVEALRIVSQAKRTPSATGASGCVERVVFKLPESMAAEPVAAD